MAQGGYWKFYGSGALYDCIVTSDSSILAVGTGLFIMKTNLQGDTLWTRHFTSSGMNAADAAFSVCETAYHEYLVLGQTGNSLAPILRLLKLDNAGNLIWDRNYGSGSGTCVKVNHRGLYNLSFLESTGNGHVHVSELDTSGNVIWTRQINLLVNDDAWSFDLDQNDNLFVVGLAQNLSTIYEGFVIKLDSAGAPVDTSIFPSYANALFDITVANDSEIYACGRANTSLSFWGTWVVKLNNTGDTLRTTILPFQCEGWSIRFDPAENLLVASGYGNDSGQTEKNAYIFWLDNSLNLLAVKRIDSIAYDDNSFGFAINLNQIYIVGYSSNGTGTQQWLSLIDTTVLTFSPILVTPNLQSFYVSERVLHYKSNNSGETVVLLDLTAVEVGRWSMWEPINTIDLSDLAKGIYIAILIDAKKNIYNAIKFIL